MERRVRTDELAKEIMRIMTEYVNNSAVDMKDEVDKVARKTVQEVKKKAPARAGGKARKYKSGKSYGPGSYRESWKSRTVEESATKKKRVVYAGQYQLTHLLEKGHEKRNGKGNTRKIPHISLAEQMAIKELEDGLKKRLER